MGMTAAAGRRARALLTLTGFRLEELASPEAPGEISRAVNRLK